MTKMMPKPLNDLFKTGIQMWRVKTPEVSGLFYYSPAVCEYKNAHSYDEIAKLTAEDWWFVDFDTFHFRLTEAIYNSLFGKEL